MDLNDYDFKDVMRACVKLFGADANMESSKNVEELIDWIGESEVPRVIEELNNA